MLIWVSSVRRINRFLLYFPRNITPFCLVSRKSFVEWTIGSKSTIWVWTILLLALTWGILQTFMIAEWKLWRDSIEQFVLFEAFCQGNHIFWLILGLRYFHIFSVIIKYWYQIFVGHFCSFLPQHIVLCDFYYFIISLRRILVMLYDFFC